MNNFEIIGVPQNASITEIRKTFRKKAKECHPDTGGNKEAFIQLITAYNKIIKEKKIESTISNNHSKFEQISKYTFKNIESVISNNHSKFEQISKQILKRVSKLVGHYNIG